ncbi:uncharacterized protein LOC127289558 [Leptopilina boulardi]|uniref:uncharacterized protein LOC127289558 n=1 Tax=Leptopilina boulardi TaxID=63433 RepID=UPI0021F5700E|nr:uncharacterized protein LOC127289558 [Leptopilina boulardi]
MSKPRLYEQKYRAVWEKDPILKDWLEPVTDNLKLASCKFCKTTLNAKLSDLQKHANTEKHKINSAPFSSNRQRKIVLKSDNFDSKRKEASICLYCAVHTSLRSVDHLTDLQNKLHKDDLHLHRTKCGNIIKNVFGPHFNADLILDIGDSPYSFLLDESTDISVSKLLGIVIRYYSKSRKEFVSTYLTLIEVENGSAETITNAVKNALTNFKLPVKNLKGIGTDNASTMVGVHNGIYERLKRELNLPNLILIRCVCHSIQLAVSEASKKALPRNIEFLIRETYKWFSKSSNRRHEYKTIYKLINDDESPLQIPKMANTRWLSIEPAVSRILDQWVELKTHFQIARLNENCYTAEILFAMYNDSVNKVYLSFLLPILQSVQSVIKSFESSVADPTKLLNDLKNTYASIVKIIVNPNARIDIYKDRFEEHLDSNPYLGFSFLDACRQENISAENQNIIKERCVSFVKYLGIELRDRLPDNIGVLEKIRLFSLDECLNRFKPSITHVAKMFYSNNIEVTKIEHQWQNLNSVNWTDLKDTLSFWSEVNSYTDASGLNPFQELGELALTLLVLPLSNADIERVFSQMNLVKTKLSNRMLLPMLNSILQIRYGLKRLKMCCHNYQIPHAVVQLIGTKESYSSNAVNFHEIEMNGAIEILELDAIDDN